jgi:hypothetical protein
MGASWANGATSRCSVRPNTYRTHAVRIAPAGIPTLLPAMENSKTLQSIRYARWSSLAFAALCVGLGVLELVGGFNLGPLHLPPRWNPAFVTFPVALQVECWFFFFFATLLVLPWQRTPNDRTWRVGFTVLCVAAFIFAFAMISEVMAKNYIANAQKMKARIPVFQAILLFVSLGQIPIALFSRKPELLD